MPHEVLPRRLSTLNIEDRLVFVRFDLNVPLVDGAEILVRDDTRIQASLNTMRYLIAGGARVVVSSHLGRPKGEKLPQLSLLPVAKRLVKLLKQQVDFVDDCIGEKVEQAKQGLRPSGVLVIENTRFYKQETENDSEFAAALAKGADVYINDAFGTLHRAHASTVGVAQCFKPENRGMGLLVEKELEVLTPLRDAPAKPSAIVLGGAKLTDKIALIRSLLPKFDKLLIGGGMAFTFLKYQGVGIGQSILDESMLTEVEKILGDSAKYGVEVLLPEDFRVADGDSAKVVEKLSADMTAFDIGPKTVEKFSRAMNDVKTVFWNGPLGMFEKPCFAQGTLDMASALAASKAAVVIGGGDTIAAYKQLGLLDKVFHASTGGGATLEFLEGKQLPGLQALL